jgi:hypothetical protein
VFNRTALRIALGLIFAMSAASVIAAPAAGAVIVKACVGTCGSYEVGDSSTTYGAKCTYGNSYPYKLLNVNVRPPLMHGNYSTKTKVGWRFKIQRQPTGGGKWLVTYTSSYQTADANDAIPAYLNHGFTRRTWTAPSNPAGYFYRVILELQWWKNGNVEGYAKARDQYYNQVRANGTGQNDGFGYCIASN